MAVIPLRAQEDVLCCKDPLEKLGQKLPWGSAGCAGTGEQQVTLSLGRRGRRAAGMQAERCSRLVGGSGLAPCFPPKSYPWWLSFGGVAGMAKAGAMSGGQHCFWAEALPRPPRVLQSIGSAGTAGVGASKPCRVSSPGHSSCVEWPWHGGNLLVS